MITLAEISSNVPANVTANWSWGLAGFAVLLGGVFWCWNQGRQALNGGNKISPQPLAIEITKQLHEQFAGKHDFDEHVGHNTERHGQLFNRIDKVEREARQRLEDRFEALAVERRESLDKLNNQFAFIREAVVELRTEIKHLQKSR